MGQNNDNYTHFAVFKETNLIVNGWDYSDYDTQDLKSDMNYYFWDDLVDYGFDNPKLNYKILGLKGCKRYGIDPDNDACWAKDDGHTPCGTVTEAKKKNPPKSVGAALRNASREDDIKNHGKPVAFKTKKSENPKAYNRKRLSKVIDEAVSNVLKKYLN